MVRDYLLCQCSSFIFWKTIQTEITSHLQHVEKVKETQGVYVLQVWCFSHIRERNVLSLLFHLPGITGPRMIGLPIILGTFYSCPQPWELEAGKAPLRDGKEPLISRFLADSKWPTISPIFPEMKLCSWNNLRLSILSELFQCPGWTQQYRGSCLYKTLQYACELLQSTFITLSLAYIQGVKAWATTRLEVSQKNGNSWK